MKKTKFNLDKVRVCLLQPEGLFENLTNAFNESRNKAIEFNGFYLSYDNDNDVNDKDITAKLFLIDKPPVHLGTFVFNKSQKYGTKCFFQYATKSLYDAAHHVYEGKEKGITNYSYFTYPTFAFEALNLTFNNVTSIEIACDTEASVISRINFALKRADAFDMILLWKKVGNPNEVLEGYYEYYQRTRLKKSPRPTLYIHPSNPSSGDNYALKVYDKARELAQSRTDKEDLIRTWNDMDEKIQRMEITVENKQFKKFFNEICKRYPNRWYFHNEQATSKEERQEEKRASLEHFFFDLGMDDKLRMEMFDYFSNHLLHFKLRNHNKTQVSILDLSINSLETLKRVVNTKSKPRCKPINNDKR